MRKKVKSVMGIVALSLALTACGAQESSTSGASGSKQGSKELVVVDYGGDFSEMAKKYLYEPFEKANNVKITVVSPSDAGKLKAMVQSNNVEWDVLEIDTDIGIRLGNEGLLEKLDYSVIDKTNVIPELVGDYNVGCITYTTNIAYNAEVYSGDNHPKTWAEFWDTAKFPGPRGFYKSPTGTLEAALMADGVAPDKMYPLDVDRALKSLDKIKGDIKVWWETGAQSTQLLATKETHLSTAWNGRVSMAKTKGSKIDNEFNQSMLMSTSWIIPKGAPNKELAQKFIAFTLDPKVQAELSEHTDYGPANRKALELMPEDVKKRLGVTTEGLANQVIVDMEYWAKNFDAINDQFNAWLLQ
ncbi:polyamine ABC transporter substrate-binding protein [Brevibacillus sp. B_LB10_24]|uniref:polyamine ABC transporter substrate-binding protein n=1 Tax=Brevibacillus sp. B_LB10_24 TaxID=3380645 RepID=UPI0038BD2421